MVDHHQPRNRAMHDGKVSWTTSLLEQFCDEQEDVWLCRIATDYVRTRTQQTRGISYCSGANAYLERLKVLLRYPTDTESLE